LGVGAIAALPLLGHGAVAVLPLARPLTLPSVEVAAVTALECLPLLLLDDLLLLLLLLLESLLARGIAAAVTLAAAALPLLALLLPRRLDLRGALLLLGVETVEPLLRRLPNFLAGLLTFFVHLLALRARLLVIGLLVIGLLLVVVPPALAVAAILRERGRSRHSRKQYRKKDLTHDCDFLSFPERGNATHQMSSG
jgi:hypothetical protein